MSVKNSRFLSSFWTFQWWCPANCWWGSWSSTAAGPASLCLSPWWSPNTWHSSTSAPEIRLWTWSLLPCNPADLILKQDDNGADGCITQEVVDSWHPGEDTQSVVLLLTQVSDVWSLIIRLRRDRQNEKMRRFGLSKVMHSQVQLWILAFSTRPGRFLMNMAEFSRLDWKCAAATYSAVLTQLFAKDVSAGE